MPDLTDRDKAILDFEGGPHWVYAGAKEDEIRRRFDMTATRYFQVRNALIDRPEALAYAPTTVKRLQRLRAARSGARLVRADGGADHCSASSLSNGE